MSISLTRLTRRLTRWLLGILAIAIGVAALGVVVAQTDWFHDWLRRYLVREAGDFINGELSVRKLEGSLISDVGFSDVEVRQAGRIVIQIRHVAINYNAWDLVTRGLLIDGLQIDQPIVHLEKTDNGWTIANLIKTSEQATGTRKPLTLSRVQIHDGTVFIEDAHPNPSLDIPDRIDRLEADLSVRSEAERSAIEVTNVAFQGSAPDVRLDHLGAKISIEGAEVSVSDLGVRTAESQLSGGVRVDHYDTEPTVSAKLTSNGLSVPELARIVVAVRGIDLRPALDLDLNGPARELKTHLRMRSSAGNVDAAIVANVAAPEQSVNGEARIENLDLAPIARDPKLTTNLTADLKVDLRSTSWADLDKLTGHVTVDGGGAAAGYAAERVSLKASMDKGRAKIDGRVAAYDADLSTAGTLTLPAGKRPLTVDLTGRTAHVNLRKLPGVNLPAADSNVNLTFHVRATQPLPLAADKGRRVDADVRFGRSVVPGVQIADGSTAHIGMRGAALAYRADASIGDLDLQRLGRTFSIPALANDRMSTNIGGHVQVEGSGTTLDTLTLHANGQISEGRLFAGRVENVGFETTIANNRAEVTATGAFNGVDARLLSGRPDVDGMLTGQLDVRGTIDQLSQGPSLDTVTASARIQLEPTMISGLEIQRAAVDADYADRVADIRTFEIAGRDLNLTASGPLALDDTHQSNVTFKGNIQRLEELEPLIGPDIAGMVRVDGQLTGNRAELQAKGTLEADRFTFKENGALASTSTFEVRIPELTVAHANVQASTRATFVTVGGQEFNQVDTKVGYEEQRITFDGTARQPQRSLDASGSVTLVPEYREVRLDRLVVAAGNQQWTVPDGTHPVVRYGGDAVQVEHLTLVNGAQEISASGAIGTDEETAGSSVKVTLTNIDLAALDALLLRQPQFSGTLSGTATVAGSTAAPAVQADVEVANGGFRDFKYQGLTAKVEYGSTGLGLDARLQQDATQWMTAKGHIPTALLTATPPDAPPRGSVHVVPPSPADSLDVAIDTSTLGLGFIQGLTKEVTNVQGTVEAHVKITGSATDPHAEGTVAFQNGAMTLPSTGVSYKSIGGRLEFQPERLHIAQITVLDNHDSSLSITGDIAVHATEIGAVQIWVNAGDFKVLDNRAGNVRIQSDLEISGELRRPRIDGDVSVTTGRLDLDEIVALTGASPYSTKQTEFVTPVPGATPDTTQEAQTPLDNLHATLRVSAPDDLVIKARNLRSPGAAISFGALNITLGGDLTATKEPGAPFRLIGEVNTVRGNYDFQGRRFEILRDGSIRFDGVNLTDPTLDLRTKREIQGIEALVSIRGRLSEPEVVLSSNPPLPDADILSLIVFNQPVNQLGEGEQVNLAARAQSLALGAGASQLAQSIGNALNVDTFELAVSSDNSNSGTVTVGQQVSQNLYIKVEQGVGEVTSTNVVLEYEISKWLRLQTNVSENESNQQSVFRRQRGSGADLMFRFER